uniref:Putative ovule protein n=1 Tax=Solanum chacoense TaxID=4108 RepID=A0A0V0I938_SOLCH
MSIPSNPLLTSGTYTDVVLDVRVENTTPNKGNVTNEGKVSDVTPSKLQIQRKITPMRLVNLDRSKWLPENMRYETKVRTTGAITIIVDRYYIEPVFGGKFRSKNEVDYFLKAGGKRKKAKNNINCDAATPSEEKNRRREA